MEIVNVLKVKVEKSNFLLASEKSLIWDKLLLINTGSAARCTNSGLPVISKPQ